MALYTYVDDAAALRAAMLDHVVKEQPPPPFEPAGWRQVLAHVGRSWWSISRRHPWLLDMPADETPPGPVTTAALARVYAALEGCGLDIRQQARAIMMLRNHVEGTLRSVLRTRSWSRLQSLESSLATSDASDLTLAADLRRLLRVVDAGGAVDPDDELQANFEWGLQCLLTGLEQALDRQLR